MGLATLIALVGVSLSCPTSHHQEVELIAHRAGMVPGIPENSLAAVNQAIQANIDSIEIDLRRSRDGHLVVIHDPTLRRTTNGRGLVSARSLAEIRRLSIRRSDDAPYEPVPTYQEVLSLIGPSDLDIVVDVKQKILPADVIAPLIEHGLVHRTVVGLRSTPSLRRFRDAAPNLRLLGLPRRQSDILPMLRAGADIIRVHPDWLIGSTHWTTEIHAAQRQIWVTAGSADQGTLCDLAEAGVDGILVDRPDRLAGHTEARR